MTKEELIRDNDYTEEEAEKMVLQNKLDKANERIGELEDRNKQAIKFISDKPFMDIPQLLELTEILSD